MGHGYCDCVYHRDCGVVRWICNRCLGALHMKIRHIPNQRSCTICKIGWLWDIAIVTLTERYVSPRSDKSWGGTKIVD
jgi:hypothetical protein